MGKTKLRPDLFEIVKSRLEGIRLLLDDMNEADAENLIQMVLGAKRIFVSGKGRSGLIAECAAMRFMQMGFDVHVPGEATCPRIQGGDLMIAISCSGETMTTVQLARIAAEAGARVAALVAVSDSSLARIAEHTIRVPVMDRDVKRLYRFVLGPYNNTLFEEALLLYVDAMIYSMLERHGIPKKRLTERHTNLE